MARHVIPLPRVDNLHAAAVGDLRSELLDRDRRHVLRRRRVFVRQRLIVPRGLDPLQHGLPVDVAEERVDVCGRVHAEVHLVGVLVHVQNEHGRGVDGRLRVIRRDLVPEPLLPARVGEEHPS